MFICKNLFQNNAVNLPENKNMLHANCKSLILVVSQQTTFTDDNSQIFIAPGNFLNLMLYKGTISSFIDVVARYYVDVT